MASKQSSPLSFMTQLSSSVFLHRPVSGTSRAIDVDSKPPRLILLLGWMDARDNHLAKYVVEYKEIYPTASVLLIKAQVQDMIWNHVAQNDVSAAMPVLRETLSANQQDDAELLVHAFSNGGSRMLSSLYQAYASEGGVLPIHVTIFDSAPAMHYSHNQTVQAILAGVPKGLAHGVAVPVVNMISYCVAFGIYVLQIPDALSLLAASHNDPIRVHEVSRTYIYSDVDALIDSQDVEAHAVDAQNKGYVVTTELFKGSPHVAHARTDGERYWKIVSNVWKDRSKPLKCCISA